MDQTQPWQELDRTRVYDDFRHIDRVLYELPDGKQKHFDIEASHGAVTVIALTPEQSVVMVRQYRPGPSKVLLEFVGGIIDPGEEPIEAAARELREETGYEGELAFIGARYLDAYSTGVQYGFVATNCRQVGEPEPDDSEFVAVEVVSLEQFQEIIQSDYAPGAGMGFLALNKLGLL
jgi:ADP-ribose pyrophosphatase